MLKYYEINGKTCFTDHMDFQCPPEAGLEGDPGAQDRRGAFLAVFQGAGKLPRLLPGES